MKNKKKIIIKKKQFICVNLYKYMRVFIRTYNVNIFDDNIYVKNILKEIENIFKSYGFSKNKLNEINCGISLDIHGKNYKKQ